jgi:hypothetical protein
MAQRYGMTRRVKAFMVAGFGGAGRRSKNCPRIRIARSILAGTGGRKFCTT